MQFLLKALIFDMDGVITDTMAYHCKAWLTVLKSQGLFLSDLDIYSREGQKGIESVESLFNEHNKPYTNLLGHQLLLEKETLFKKIFKSKFIPGSRSFINQYYRQGFKLALVTGSSRDEANKLLPKELFASFNITICGTDVRQGKPHPEPYLRALADLKVRPNEALVIENAPLGIRSAKAAGLTCLALETSLPASYLNEADGVFSSFKDMQEQVKFIKDIS